MSELSRERRSGGSVVGPLLFLLIILLAAIAAVRLSSPPPLRPVAAEGFDARRAFTDLKLLLSEQRPHPTGTAANRMVRDRIVTLLAQMGLRPEIQRAFACDPRGSCADVENIVVRLGPATGKSLLLLTHYDSAGAGPGASDDGLGTAALLEIARLLRNEPLRHPLTILFSDGEELGLLGAYAYAATPAMASVGAVINIEARGTTGRSLMFETGPDDLKIVRTMRGIRRPATGSLFVAIYKLLPNDTDFSVFKRAGLPGLNFASIGGVTRYHTRADDIAHFDLATLQHHGDNVLSVTRELQRAKLEDLSGGGDATFFDILGRRIVIWPERLNLASTITLLLFALLIGVWSVRSRRIGILRILYAMALPLLAAALSSVMGWALLYLLRLMKAAPSSWIADPRAAIAAFWLVALLAVLVVSRLAIAKETHAVSVGCAILFGAASVALAILMPGATYIALVPASLFLIAALVTAGGLLQDFAAALVLLGISLAWFPLLFDLYDALGLPLMPAVGGLVALVIVSGVPLVARASRRAAQVLILLCGATLIVALAVAFSRPPYDASNPLAVNLFSVQEEPGAAPRLLVATPGGELPPALRDRLRLARAPEGYPWSRNAWSRPSSAAFLPEPEITILGREVEGGRVRLMVRQRSARGATVARLFIRSGNSQPSVRLRGQSLGAPPRRGSKGWRLYQDSTLPPDGIVWHITFASGDAEVWLGDIARGTGGIDPRAVAARDGAGSPFGFGDYSMATRRLWPVAPR